MAFLVRSSCLSEAGKGREFPCRFLPLRGTSEGGEAPISGVSGASFTVGYAQSGLRSGGTVLTAQFCGIGATDAMSLQSIVPTGDDIVDNVSLMTLDSYGRTVDSYAWCDYAGDSGEEVGWANDDLEIVEGVTFAPGQGLWISASSSEQNLQSAGKVGTEDVTITLRSGGTVVGNPFPVSVGLQDILPAGDDIVDNVSLMTLDSYGHTIDSYVWCDYAGDSGEEVGWVNDDLEVVEGVSFTPGQGLWISASSTEQTIRFPAHEL